MNEIDKTRAKQFFYTLQAYRQFRIDWAYACWKLNPSKENWERLEEALASEDQLWQK